MAHPAKGGFHLVDGSKTRSSPIVEVIADRNSPNCDFSDKIAGARGLRKHELELLRMFDSSSPPTVSLSTRTFTHKPIRNKYFTKQTDEIVTHSVVNEHVRT